MDRLAGPVQPVLEDGQNVERVLVQLVRLGRDPLETRERAGQVAPQSVERIAYCSWVTPAYVTAISDDIKSLCRFRVVERPPLDAGRLRDRASYVRSEAPKSRRAVRGAKERSEAAAIVAKYADLFTRYQLDLLRRGRPRTPYRTTRARAPLPFRVRAPNGGLLSRELVDMQDEVQNELLAIRIDFGGEDMPLRNAEAKPAVLDESGIARTGRDPRRRDGDDERRRLDVARAAEER